MKQLKTFLIPYICDKYQKITIFMFTFLKSLETAFLQSQLTYLSDGYIRDNGASLLQEPLGNLGYIATAE